MAQMKDDYYKDKEDKKEEKWEKWKKLKKEKSGVVKLEWVFYSKLKDIVWAIDIARELTSKPSNVVDPDYLEKYVKDNLEKWKDLTIKYFWQKEIEKEEMADLQIDHAERE